MQTNAARVQCDLSADASSKSTRCAKKRSVVSAAVELLAEDSRVDERSASFCKLIKMMRGLKLQARSRSTSDWRFAVTNSN